MGKKKLILTQKQVELLAENELSRLRSMESETPSESPENSEEITPEKLHPMIGDDEADRHIEYPTPGDIEAIKTGNEKPTDGEKENAIDPKDMKSPPHELLEYLKKIDEAKSILSKVAAKEDNENIKNRIYSHYEKAQKLGFELIKEFGIVH